MWDRRENFLESLILGCESDGKQIPLKVYIQHLLGAWHHAIDGFDWEQRPLNSQGNQEIQPAQDYNKSVAQL